VTAARRMLTFWQPIHGAAPDDLQKIYAGGSVRFMSERVGTIIAAAIISACWSLISGAVLVMVVGLFVGPIG
jgi:hypothetical protein